MAPMVATRLASIDFIVLMGAPGLSGEAILLEQTAISAEQGMSMAIAMMEEQGQDPLPFIEAMKPMIETMQDNQLRTFAILKTTPDSLEAATQLRLVLKEQIAAAQTSSGVDTDALVDTQISQINTRWMRFFLSHDPQEVLARVTCPVLAIGGENDTQVFSSDNLAAIGDALREGGNSDVTTIELDDLNHLFQTATTGYRTEYRYIEETFAPKALEVIGNWILEKAAAR